ncbi:MFS transporter [Streptomyces sp. AV19]|uniref:MFS transporter n=1 Tax=Streptomyces sp. AV19 TaxID=2793068 RepID=UPI0018FE8274|nr:MFS transporter [Streptomyces sp. AV19]MBH1934225.1 MFS transporter [Streptomyces sp. AV19]MDG4536490.1 MFS transporter [Streptomyces sp. AV19]
MTSGTNGPPRRFLALLTRRHVAGAAWWSVVARLPVYVMSLALILVVREQGGGYARAGLVAALYTLGLAAGGPLVARRVDRHGRRVVLAVTAVVCPASVAVLVWAARPDGWLQPAAAVLTGVSLPPANAVMRSLWARLPLEEAERDTAFLWEALLTEVLVIGAPLLLAALMLAGSAGLALTVVSAVGGAGALGLASVRAPAERASANAGRHPLGPLRSPAMAVLLGVMAACAVPIGLTTLAVPAFVDAHGSPGGTGAVYACWGVGSAVGALWLGRSSSRVPAHRRFPRLVLAYALGAALPLAATDELTLAAALAVGGAPIALVSASEMTLVGRIADSRLLTEAFTWASLATVAGDALGQQAGGLLVDRLGPEGVFAVAFGVALGAAGVAFGCGGLLGRGAGAVPVGAGR